MNGLLILLLSALVLAAGYFVYAKCIEKSWGVDSEALTPAIRLRDRWDYLPSRSWVLLAHELVSICAVLVVFGPIQAARYGWVPVLLWILLGGVFIGGVQEFGALYASVKTRGLTLGGLLGQFAGARMKKVFLVFAWLVCVVAIAAFTDIAARALDGFLTVEETDPVSGRAGTILLLLYVFALLAGLAGRYSKITPMGTRLISATILLCAVMLGMPFPVSLHPTLWQLIILSFAVLSAAGPVWLTLHPRAHLHTYLYCVLLLLLLAGLFAGPKTMLLPAFSGFSVGGRGLFPWLFMTLTFGAVSGLQALTASGVISRQISSEVRMRRVSYGGVMLQCFLAVAVLVFVGTQLDAAALAGAQDPAALFLSAAGGILSRFGIDADISASLYILMLVCLCVGALEAIARAARVCWEEFFDYGDREPTAVQYALENGWLGAGVTLLAALGLCRLGYGAVWPLFGSAVQALSALALLICAVWLRGSRRKSVWVWIPMVFMLLASITALILTLAEAAVAISSTKANLLANAAQLVLSAAILVILLLLCFQGFRRLLSPPQKESEE